MTGICWRLLACFSLIFLVAALRGQTADVDRSRAIAPTLATSPSIPLSRAVPLSLPVDGPWRDPVARGTIALPQIVRAAGIIFSGRVTFVGRADGRAASSSGQSAGSTGVPSRVKPAFGAPGAGQSRPIHEWSGLGTGRELSRGG